MDLGEEVVITWNFLEKSSETEDDKDKYDNSAVSKVLAKGRKKVNKLLEIAGIMLISHLIYFYFFLFVV